MQLPKLRKLSAKQSYTIIVMIVIIYYAVIREIWGIICADFESEFCKMILPEIAGGHIKAL